MRRFVGTSLLAVSAIAYSVEQGSRHRIDLGDHRLFFQETPQQMHLWLLRRGKPFLFLVWRQEGWLAIVNWPHFLHSLLWSKWKRASRFPASSGWPGFPVLMSLKSLVARRALEQTNPRPACSLGPRSDPGARSFSYLGPASF